MEIQIPPDILENTQAVLAVLAMAISIAGMLLCLGAYAAFFISMQNIDATVSPQFDSAYLLISGSQSAILSASNSSESLAAAMLYISNGTAAYSQSTSSLSDSLSAVSKVPPFSLDTKFASAVASMDSASASFAQASASMNESAASAAGISATLGEATYNLGQAGQSIAAAKESFKSAILMADIAGLFGCIALVAFFSGVIFTSLSILLSHYPRLFGKKQEGFFQRSPPEARPGPEGKAPGKEARGASDAGQSNAFPSADWRQPRAKAEASAKKPAEKKQAKKAAASKKPGKGAAAAGKKAPRPATKGAGPSKYEKAVHEKYGRTGVQVYRMADGKKTGEEILKETGISEDRLIEMLQFMDKKGIIKLEKP